MLGMRSTSLLGAADLWAASLWGCGEGGSSLAKGDGGAAEGASGGTGGGPAATTTTTTGAGGQGGIEEPPGPTKLTVVAGIVDAAAIQFCFMSEESSGMPWPGTGLPYAHAGTLEPPTGTIEVIAIGGDLASVGGKSCDELSEQPPAGTVVRSLGIVPGEVLTAERSILLVANGCLGGTDHSDPLEESVCGLGYEPELGNAGLIAGFMSRIALSDKVPLQFAQASVAMPPYDLKVKTHASASPQAVITGWSLGALQPFPPFLVLSQQALAQPNEARLGVYPSSAQDPVFEAPWSVAFANSELSASDVQNGRGLVFVAVGPAPTVPVGPWWQGHTYTVVLADP
jgi:hypothetical protein